MPDLGPPASIPPDKRASMDLSPTASPAVASLELCSRASFSPREKALGQNFMWGRGFSKGQDDNSG